MSFAIDLLRHLFAVAVIVHHMRSETRYSDATNALAMDTAGWVAGAVAGFFLISGFLYKQPESVSTALAKNARKLLVPYAVFSALYAWVLAMLGKMALGSTLAYAVTLHGAGVPQLYFLLFLFLILSVQAIVGFRPERRTLAFFAYALGVLAAALAIRFPKVNGAYFQLLPFYGTAFLVGMVDRWLFETATHRTAKMVLLGVGLGALGWIDAGFWHLGTVAVLIALVLSVSPHLPERRIPGSGAVYVLHAPILNYAVSIALGRLGLHEVSNLVASVAVTFFLCVALAWMVRSYASRWSWLIFE